MTSILETEYHELTVLYISNTSKQKFIYWQVYYVEKTIYIEKRIDSYQNFFKIFHENQFSNFSLSERFNVQNSDFDGFDTCSLSRICLDICLDICIFFHCGRFLCTWNWVSSQRRGMCFITTIDTCSLKFLKNFILFKLTICILTCKS